MTMQGLSYGGRCARCGGKGTTTIHSLPATPAAVAAANALRSSLERHRRLDFDASDPSSSCSDSYSTLPFLPRSEGGNGGPGRMLGVLLCDDGTVLRAFSGQLALSSSSSGEGGGGWDCPGWAGTVAGITNASLEYGRFRALSDALTRRIEGAGDKGGDNRQKLRARRRALSHALIARVQDSYVTRDLLGRTLSLREAYLALAEEAAEETAEGNAEPPPLPITRLWPGCGGGPHQANDNAFLGFPAGTGDCCAPKLLHEAALRGLKPVGLAEFWFGAPPDGDGGNDDGGGDGALSATSSSTESEGEEEEGEGTANISDKEAAWRRRQRRRVLKAQGRRRRAVAATMAPSRAHGEFCGPCFKCMGILGTMLCSCV